MLLSNLLPPNLPHTRLPRSASLWFLLIFAITQPRIHAIEEAYFRASFTANYAEALTNPLGIDFVLLASSDSNDPTISSLGWRPNTFVTFATIVALLGISGFYHFQLLSLRRQKKDLVKQLEERTSGLRDANSALEAKQSDIERQNQELSESHNTLEAIVKERTEKMEAALLRAEDSERLKSVFLANVSHEIRTPMNAIVGFSSLLEDSHVTETERSEYVDLIRSNADVLIGLIDDIVEVSRIEAKQVASSYSRFDLDLKLEELEIYYKTASRRPIEINFLNRGMDPPFIIETDELLFGQIMSCLIGNAIKYTTKGSVDFGYQLGDHDITLYVADTGIGIPEHEHEKIFDRFYKITQKGSELYRGLGLGLSITQSLVRLLEGQIWLKSAPGKGSTFYIRLPLKKQKLAQ